VTGETDISRPASRSCQARIGSVVPTCVWLSSALRRTRQMTASVISGHSSSSRDTGRYHHAVIVGCGVVHPFATLATNLPPRPIEGSASQQHQS
jgi:hypothetical protein